MVCHRVLSPSLPIAHDDFAKQFLSGSGQFAEDSLTQAWPGSLYCETADVRPIASRWVGEKPLAIARLSGAGKCDALNESLEIGKVHADRRALGENESGWKIGRAGAPARPSGGDLGRTGVTLGAAESIAPVRATFNLVLPAVLGPAADGGLAGFAGRDRQEA